MRRDTAFRAAAIAATAIVAAAVMFAAPASAETRRIDGQAFHAIEISGPYELEYVAGPTHEVVITGETRRLNRMRARVRNGVLQISRRCTFFCSSRGTYATVQVTAPSIRAFEVSMGAEARAAGVDAERLEIDVSMGGGFTIAGTCGRLNADVSMGAVLRAEGLLCRDVTVDASMGAEADVYASGSVNADASMGGDVDVAGGPSAREVSRSMGGDITVR